MINRTTSTRRPLLPASSAALVLLVGALAPSCIRLNSQVDPTATSSTSDTTTDGTTTMDTSTTTMSTTTLTTSTTTMTTMTSTTMTSTTEDPTTTTTTTGGPECDMDLTCDEGMGEDIVGCLHDCGICTPTGTCQATKETPYSCPEDCPATGCDNDGTVDALMEQCDDGNMVDEDACTNACNLNVCGDGVLFPEAAGGMEECDDGNADAGDGCSPGCKFEARTVFVTSTVHTGKLGGLEGADAKCNMLAMGKVTGTFGAWLSDGQTSAASRLNLAGFQGPFVLVDGEPVAMGWSGLTSGSLLHAINKNESGLDTSAQVWTNTNKDGSVANSGDCNGWTDETDNFTGGRGSSAQTGEKWTLSLADACNGGNRLYCVQVK